MKVDKDINRSVGVEVRVHFLILKFLLNVPRGDLGAGIYVRRGTSLNV